MVPEVLESASEELLSPPSGSAEVLSPPSGSAGVLSGVEDSGGWLLSGTEEEMEESELLLEGLSFVSLQALIAMVAAIKANKTAIFFIINHPFQGLSVYDFCRSA